MARIIAGILGASMITFVVWLLMEGSSKEDKKEFLTVFFVLSLMLIFLLI